MNWKHLPATLAITLCAVGPLPAVAQQTLTGQDAFTDYTKEHPGVRRKVTVADLPQPYATESANNAAAIAPRPDGVWPQTLPGFKVEQFATGLENPRLMRMAPMATSSWRKAGGKGHRHSRHDRRRQGGQMETFATDQKGVFGINFYPSGPNPKWVYVGNTASVVRFPYQVGDMKASGPGETLTELPGGGGHRTRDIVFTPDGKHMLVSVGSHSNVDDPDTTPAEFHRADVLEFTPEANSRRCMRRAFAIALERPFSPPRASCGAR